MIIRVNDNYLENNAWNYEHNVGKLQEILNRIMQGIMSIITSVLLSDHATRYMVRLYHSEMLMQELWLGSEHDSVVFKSRNFREIL